MADAFAGTISPDITIGAHAMAVTEGLWDEPRFIRYAAERRLPLKFVTASFYDYRPGKFTRGMNVPRTIAHLRAAAVSAGLTNLFYGVDEGRILCGAKGADKGGRATGAAHCGRHLPGRLRRTNREADLRFGREVLRLDATLQENSVVFFELDTIR